MIDGLLGGKLRRVSPGCMTHLQHVIVAVLMVFNIKLMDGNRDAAASGSGDVPGALSVFWVPVGVVWAVERATGSRELPSTTCTAKNSTRVS